MLTIPQYLIESSFCLLIFYGFYHFLLRKETFFQLNRAYLVMTPALSLSIPLLNISFQHNAPPESFEAFLYPAIQSANNINELVWEQMRAPSPVFSLSVADVLMTVYMVGVFLMAFSLLRGLWNLSQIISNGKRSKNNDFTLVETKNNFPAASFFGYIFWNQQITDEQKLILEHEKVHIRQWHSLDVLLMEFCVIIKWFNPLIYWFRNALKATHEYIADQYVIQQKSNVQDYATLLVNQQKSLSPTPLTNTFYSMTTKRLKMMLQKPSDKTYAAKYLMIIPVISGLMLLFSFNLLEEIPRVGEGLIEMNAAINDLAETTVFEIEKPLIDQTAGDYLATEEGLATLGKEETSSKVHFGNSIFSMNPFQQMQHEWKNNVISSQELIELLRQKISFTDHNSPLHIEAIELFIPKSNGGNALQIHTSKSEHYKFSEQDFKSLIERLNPDDNVTLNIYGEIDTYITRFNVRNEKEEKGYQLFWGNLEIPIKYYDSDDNGTLGHDMELNTFLKVLRQPLKLKKKGEPFIPKNIEVSIYGNDATIFWSINKNKKGQWDYLEENAMRTIKEIEEGDIITYEKPKSDFIKLSLKGAENITFSPKNYERIFKLIEGKITITLRTMDDFLLATSINIKNPSSEYHPPHRIREKQKKVYHFQLITPIEGKPILKIDTIKSAKTAKLFRDKSKYKIIHIPNFQTIERTLDEKDINDRHDEHRIRPILYNSITKADLLPNYIVDQPAALKFIWGDLVAAPESENLSLKAFFQNNVESPKLLYQEKALSFSKIRLTIVNKKNIYTNTFSSADFGTTKMNEILGKVDNKTSIYFDKIELLDEGVTKHLQHRFLFNVGNKVLKSSFEKSTPKSSIQIKWGKYSFNCQEKIENGKKSCNCEGKYLRKADLEKINHSGLEFLVDGKPQDVENISVSTHGFVYCEKEELMISSDQQKTYDPNACIWTAFDEGDRGWVRFKSNDYQSVHFTFSIDSQKGSKTIDPPFIKIKDEKVNLPSRYTSINEKLSFTFGQIKDMINQPLSINYFEEKSEINHIKIAVTKDRLRHKFEDLKDPSVFNQIENFYPDDKVFYMDYMPNLRGENATLYFQLNPDDELFKKKATEFSWGNHFFSFNDPILKLSKKELSRLIKDEDIKNYLGESINRASSIRFILNEEDNTIYPYIYGRHKNYQLNEMLQDPLFKKQFDLLKAGDFLNINNLSSDLVSGDLIIFIDEEIPRQEPFFKLMAGKGKIKNKFNHPQFTFYRNQKLSDILSELLEIKPHKLKFRNAEHIPLINLTYVPKTGIDAKADLISRLKAAYPFTIKQKIVEKESWFLSNGDTEKLEQFRQKNLPVNLTMFIEDNTNKGIETLGPVKFDWFATQYLKSKYQIEVINLTDHKGKFVLPLDTQNLQSLQQQLKKDFDLNLKKQKRSIEIKEVIFE